MPVRTDGPAPYTSPSAILKVIEKYRDHGLLAPFTNDVLLRAGISDSLVPRTISSLQQLDLTDEDGNPTSELEALAKVPETEYKDRLADLVRAVYAEVFSFVDPAKADLTAIRDAFRAYTPRGQQRRMVSLFVGLCEAAGIITEAPKPARNSRRRSTRDSSQKSTKANSGSSKPASSKQGSSRPAQKPSTPPAHGSLPPALAGLIASLPPDGESWTKDEREKFLTTFPVVLDFCYRIVEQKPHKDEAQDTS